MRTTAGDEPAFSCKPSGALKNKAASAVMRQAAKPGVPGKESWSGLAYYFGIDFSEWQIL